MTPETETVPASLYRALRDERDELAERLRQIGEENDGGCYEDHILRLCAHYGVSRCGAHILWWIMHEEKPGMYQIVDDWPTGEGHRSDILKTVVCKLRKRMKPHQIEIMTLWGHGYFASEEDRAELRRVAEGRDAA